MTSQHLHYDKRIHRNLTAKAVFVTEGKDGFVCKVSGILNSIGDSNYSII
jgi:hypothetical protein